MMLSNPMDSKSLMTTIENHVEPPEIFVQSHWTEGMFIGMEGQRAPH
jgi:hypothetical protein